MRLRTFAALAAILLSASGCASAGPGMADPGGEPGFCQVFVPHGLPAAALAVMTAEEVSAWEDNLIAYEVLCDE